MTKPGVQALLDKARANLDAARLLPAARHLDSSASRGYYAMFYVAEALLAQLGQSYSKHAGVIAAFGREYAKTGKLDPKFHRWLIDAQGLRSVADGGCGRRMGSSGPSSSRARGRRPPPRARPIAAPPASGSRLPHTCTRGMRNEVSV